MNGISTASGKLLAMLFAGLLVGVGTIYFLIRVTEWGHAIPSVNVVNDYCVAIAWWIAIAGSFLLWPISEAEKKILLAHWVLRGFVTLGLMLFYENNYGLDAYQYFQDAKELTYNWSSMGFGNGTANIGGVVWLMNHYLPMFGSYHAIKVCFSLIGLVGVYLAYRGLVRFSGKEHPKLFLYAGLLPSLVFWSSILGKDPVVLFGTCLYAWGVLSWLRDPRSLPAAAAIAAGIIVASWIRSWNGLILFVPLSAVGVFSLGGNALRIIYLVGIAAGTRYTFDVFVEQFQLVGVDDLVHKTNIISKSWSLGGSAQVVPDFYSVSDMLSFAPVGMFTALFRPLPGEIANLFGLLAGLENLGLVILLGISILRFRFRKLLNPAAFWAFLFLVFWSFVYSFVSYQNLGSAFRFRLQVLPVLLVFLLYLAQAQEDTSRKAP